MRYFFDTNKKTLPEQVKKNTEDIKTMQENGFFANPTGEYDETKTYHKYDLASYDGNSYIFISNADAVGIPITNEDYWRLYTSGGLSIEIGTTQTLPAGSNASVVNSGTKTAAVLNFGIPKGEKGDKGDKGDTGATGAQGPQGEQGEQGPQGPAGQGVPSGGTAGQVLTKDSDTDYDASWQNASGGKVYLHIIKDTSIQRKYVVYIYTSNSTTFNNSTFASFLYNNGYTSSFDSKTYNLGSDLYRMVFSNNALEIPNGFYSENGTSLRKVWIQINFSTDGSSVSGSIGTNSGYAGTISDTVIEL